MTYITLDSNQGVIKHRLADELTGGNPGFQKLWQLHPGEFPTIFLHGRKVALPRWQQAYGRSYFFSGQSSIADPVPCLLQPYLTWARQCIDRRLNGMLLNWYDGEAGHYIGAHRDSTKDLLTDSPIVMISLGGQRVMRFRPIVKGDFIDVEIANGDVLIMPYSTNKNFKHEVPRFKRHTDKRISITLRCFG